MPTRISWLLMLALAAGPAAGCQSTDSQPPAYQFVEAWGESGTEPGQFRQPIGIDVAGEEVLVSEAGNRRIQVFSRAGTAKRQIGPALSGGDSLRRPMHLAVADSAVYVPDYNTDRVHVLSMAEAPRAEFDPSASGAGFDAPGGVAVDRQGRVYVTDFYHHRVLRFAADGTFDRQWGVTDSSGTEPNRFTHPTDVAPLPDGGFVVADAYNHRIKRYGGNDSLAWTRPKDQSWADSTKGAFNVATAVATNSEGQIYVADFYNHRVQVFSADGDLLTAFGEQGNGDGQFERPVDVAVTDDGTLHIVDFGNDRVQTFRRSS